jgi:hypothetical protein
MAVKVKAADLEKTKENIPPTDSYFLQMNF